MACAIDWLVAVKLCASFATPLSRSVSCCNLELSREGLAAFCCCLKPHCRCTAQDMRDLKPVVHLQVFASEFKSNHGYWFMSGLWSFKSVKTFCNHWPPREPLKSARKWDYFFWGVTRTSCAAGRGGVSSSSSSNLVWWDLKRRICKSFPSLGCACKSWIDMQAGMSVFANSPLCISGQVFSCWLSHQIVGSTPNIWESDFCFTSSDSCMNINWSFFPNARAWKSSTNCRDL